MRLLILLSLVPVLTASFVPNLRAEVIANANAEFAGSQGSNGWYWGYYDRSADLNSGGDGIFSDDEFKAFSGGAPPTGASDNMWVFGDYWDFAGGAPFTEITSTRMIPNNFRGVQHFAMIRWISDEAGIAKLTGFFDWDQSQPTDGTIGRIYRNGEEIFAEHTLEEPAPFDLTINNLAVGDIFDFAVDFGTDYNGNGSNDSTLYQFIFDLIAAGVPGDFDGSGVLDLADINILTQQSASGANDAQYDLTDDDLVNSDDVTEWAHELFGTWLGDANLDRLFNSDDLITVAAENTYDNGSAAVWGQGDFDGDGFFSPADLITAAADLGYEAGEYGAVSAVPEPHAALLLLLGCCVAGRSLRARRVQIS